MHQDPVTASHEEFTHSTLATHTPHTIEFPNEFSGKRVWIVMCWQNARGILGRWTEMQTAIIPKHKEEKMYGKENKNNSMEVKMSKRTKKTKGAFMKAKTILWMIMIALIVILASCSSDSKTTAPKLPPTDNFSDFWNFYEYDVILMTNPEGPWFSVLTTRETMFDEDFSVKVNGEEAIFVDSSTFTFLGQSIRDYNYEKELVPGEEYHLEIRFLGKTYAGRLKIAYVLSLTDYPDPYDLTQPGTFGWHLEDDNQRLFVEYQAQLPINSDDLYAGPFVMKPVSPSLRSYTIPADMFTGYRSIGFYLESLNFTQGEDFMLFSRQYAGVQYFVDFGTQSNSAEATISATPTECISEKISNIERVFELMQLLKEQE